MWIKNNAMWVFVSIFGLVGGGMLVIGVFWAQNSLSYVFGGEHKEGEVSEIIDYVDDEGSRMYKPRVVFDEGEYVPSVSSSISGYRVGQKVELLVSDTGAKINSFSDLWFGPVILLGMGVVFAGIGGGVGVSVYKRQKDIEWLKVHGRRIEADFSGLGAGNVRVNGNSGWTVMAQWQNPMDNKIYLFESETMWMNPEKYIGERKISVLIDNKNPKRYWVNVDFLPKVA
jgi:hypothetical protein